jgi:hypothetical protein
LTTPRSSADFYDAAGFEDVVYDLHLQRRSLMPTYPLVGG